MSEKEWFFKCPKCGHEAERLEDIDVERSLTGYFVILDTGEVNLYDQSLNRERIYGTCPECDEDFNNEEELENWKKSRK